MMERKESLGRREFFKTSALLGGTVLATTVAKRLAEAGETEFITAHDYPLNEPEHIIYSVCLQCNTGCGIKVKLLDSIAVKIDGNPLSPKTMLPHLPYNTPVQVLAKIDGPLCPKGQAGLQTVYDPYRIRKVLKRAGKRGENKWMTIPFEQAIDEIVNGGYLFKHVPGEENRYVPGLKDIWALRDPKVAKEMADEVAKIRKVAKEVNEGKKPKAELEKAINEFKAKFKDHLHTLIDPDHPDLGPKNNQLVFNWGRMKSGRAHFVRRFFNDAFGSVNTHGHTTVCQGSLYFAGKAMSEQWSYDPKSKEVKWTGGTKDYWQADTGNAEFIIFVGASPFEGNYGPPGRSVRVTNSLSRGTMKIAVIDPRFSKTASKAWKWIPIKPGTESAFALAMIRWIIENKRYDARYLANANKAAAKADGEPTWSNATWLVKIDEKGNPGKFLRAHEIGIAPVQKRKAPDGTEYDYELFVVLKDGKPIAVDPNDEQNPVEGDLFVDTTLKGIDGKEIRVKSALQLLYEASCEHTIAEWAEICGVKVGDIVVLADEFTKHGKKAVADIHRGVSQHTNGFYNCLAWNCLNLLIGNYDWKGGFIRKSEWNITGDREGVPIEHKPFIFRNMHPNKLTPFGISIIRHEVKYEETTLFSGYPAKRPWYPLASDIYQEVIPSIGDQYPYPVKCLMLYMGSPVYALPAGDKLVSILTDTEKLPLFIAIDIIVGETSMFADYIFPDLTYLERWEFHGSHPSFAPKIQPIRQPAIPPIPETVKVFGEEMPISLEAVLMAIAEKLGLSGFGKDGFGPGMPFTHPDHFYLKMVANVAAGDKPGEEVPDADDAELEIFVKARSHLPKCVFDLKRWQESVGEKWWRKVVYVLNRGGRFEDYDHAYDGNLVRNKYGKLVSLYSEKVATTKSAMTGKPFSGIARFFPPYTDCLGRQIEDKAYDLTLITFREITQTKTRTISNYWLLSVLPENAILVNPEDAQRLGLEDGDLVHVLSASNPKGEWVLGPSGRKPLIGKVKITEGIRPGVVGFALGFGHWAYGSSDIIIDGEVIKGDPRRAKGVHLNASMRVDPVLGNTSLSDPVGASVVFYETKVTLRKLAGKI
ncbi:MAG: molybdopterin-dependent oxidoreductase [Armatimonadota bacterium]